MQGEARALPNMVNVSKGGCLARSRAGLILTSRFGTEGARHTPSSNITPPETVLYPLQLHQPAMRPAISLRDVGP